MKYGFYIVIWFFLLGCRSTRDSNRFTSIDTDVRKESQFAQKDSTVTEQSHRDSTATLSTTSEFLRTTTFRNDGTIHSLQEYWRNTGSTELSVSSGRQTNVSVTQQHASSTIDENKKEIVKEEIKTTTDTRPIQGFEWFWIVVVIVAAVLFLLPTFIKKKE